MLKIIFAVGALILLLWSSLSSEVLTVEKVDDMIRQAQTQIEKSTVTIQQLVGYKQALLDQQAAAEKPEKTKEGKKK